MIITVAISLACLGTLTHSTPQYSVTDLPHYTKLSDDEVRHLQNRGFGPTIATEFGSENAEEPEDSSVASSQQRSVTYADDNPYVFQNAIPIKQTKVQYREQQQVQQATRPRSNYPQQFRPTPQSVEYREQQVQQTTRPRSNYPQQFKPTPQSVEQEQKESEEEEVEEPDRLTLLLPQTKFTCSSKNTGYYADEELGCEVFHYCQDNARHSWICPEGFTFHQVHLICMPPGGDNICSKSSQFHFVNDYLYKPVNLEEYQHKPNVSLKYSERYYPDSYHYDDDEGQANHHRASVRVRDPEAPVPQTLLVNQPTRSTFRPETTLGQVFRSPNEVNIPLQQRRPQYATQRYLRK